MVPQTHLSSEDRKPGVKIGAEVTVFLKRLLRKRPSQIVVALAALFFASASSPLGADELPIRGRVVAPGGAPIEGARVTLEPLLGRWALAQLRLGGELRPKPVDRAATGPEGRYELAAPEMGGYRVVVEAEGHAAAQTRVSPVLGPRELPTAELPPATTVELKLHGPEGQSLQALIALRHPRGRLDTTWWLAPRLVRSGTGGRARLTWHRGGPAIVEAVAPGFPPLRRELSSRALAKKVELGFAAGRPLKLRLRDPGRRLLPGAVVFAKDGTLPLAAADEEAKLELAVAGEGLEIEALSESGHRGDFELDPVDPGAESPLDLRLGAPVLVRGRVIELESRDPLPGALVWDLEHKFIRAGRGGAFSLTFQPERAIIVRAVAPGFGVAFENVQPKKGVSEYRATLGLRPAVAVEGTVVDPRDEPIEGAEIHLGVPQNTMPNQLAFFDPQGLGLRALSGRDGRFELSGLMPGVGYELAVLAPGHAPGVVGFGPLEVGAEKPDLRIVLETGRRGVGRVVGADGEPIAGAEVRIVRLPEKGMRARTITPADEPIGAETDAEGRFFVTGLAPGEVELHARAPGHAPVRIPGIEVPAERNEFDLGEVVLEPGARLEGRVVDTEGRAVAGAELRLGKDPDLMSPRIQPFGWPSSASDARGRFIFEDLRPDERVFLRIAKSGYDLAEASAEPGEEKLEIVLEGHLSLSGRVIDPEGRPIEGARVSIGGEIDGRFYGISAGATTDAEGRFETDKVAPDATLVRAWARGHQPSERIPLERGEEGALAEVEIMLELGFEVEGRVIDSVGAPVMGALVFVESSGGSPGPSGQSDSEGLFRLEGVAPGEAELAAVEGPRQVTEAIEVGPGSRFVEIVLPAGFEVSGRVVDPEGTGLERIVVELTAWSDPGTLPVREVTDAAGAFRFDDVGPGTWAVTARAEGLTELRSPGQFVVEAPVTGLELVLGSGTTLRGRVLGLSPDDLLRVGVIVGRPGSRPRPARTDYEGEYRAEGLGPGDWAVIAEVPGGERLVETFEVAPGELEVVLDLNFESGYRLRGVVLENGVPLGGTRVALHAGQEMGSLAVADAQGRFELLGLEEGVYHAHFEARGLDFARNVEVRGDAETRFEVSTTALSGRVVDAAGSPLSGVEVELHRLVEGEVLPGLGAWPRPLVTESGAGGLFRFSRVEVGAVQLRAIRGESAAEIVVELLPGGELSGLELRLAPEESDETP